jgi:hypothetical protein
MIGSSAGTKVSQAQLQKFTKWLSMRGISKTRALHW